MFDHIYLLMFLAGLPMFLFMIYNLIIGFKGLYCKYQKYPKHAARKHFCAVVAARNEEGVIGQLVDTLKAVNYPSELLDVWVIPNNCTDQTGAVAASHGANIYNPVREIHSKGEALNEFFDHIFSTRDIYDAFCVFDADNLVDPEFFQEMNNAMCEGVRIAQGYREAKNPKDSWVSGSQSMFYYVVNRFINEAKYRTGLSAILNGTGFMVCRDILEEHGFNTFSLTEDIEFSTQNIIRGERIAFIPGAVTYDEHPVDEKVSIKQRRRWSTGTIQVLYHYTPMLWESFKQTRNFTCLDMIVYLLSPYMQILSTIYTVITLVLYGMIAAFTQDLNLSFLFSVVTFVGSYLSAIIFCAYVLKMEHHKLADIARSAFFSFWYFIMSWSVINAIVFFKPTTSWEPIEHGRVMEFADLKNTAQACQ